MKKYMLLCWCLGIWAIHAQPAGTRFRALVLYENGGHHLAYSQAARGWLDSLAAAEHFAVDYLQNTDRIDDVLLADYQLFIQLDYPPYAWTKKAEAAFINYITSGRGGWIGFHHATLLGEFDGYPMWQWFHQFMGGIRFTDYIATFASAMVIVERPAHPVMQGVASTFRVEQEEWYTYDRSPRPNVDVLAAVDESSYRPDSKIKMGDHPVVWSNPDYAARNVYIFMGHSPDLFHNENYKKLVANAIAWAAKTDR
ncbi:ThuA domain-containing protein [Parapedobacter lycopersici]|uniref:ThuA domain-containing protein n=1 Tax=Parapedobacter lycopersici TaxID=1864939 RepID=UPI00214D2B49|nr:ThuA domain-containing protein [Parapedobacter lycopersici]